MLNSTFNHLKTFVKDSFALVKSATVGTCKAISQDVSKVRQDVKDFREFQEWKAQQEADKSTATRTGAKK